ncbi:MAG: pyridoxal phosphate-dependent aminotransferase [Phycisphaeraceae bacterium]|nr:pyridoxal phosphate-dependent aminotransferase [Phycisphaeraceae bacterium]
MDIARLLSDRARAVEPSGIRRISDLAARIPDAINLSIGQPDFAVPEAIKRAAVDAIEQDRNGYSTTVGVGPLREAIHAWVKTDLGWDCTARGDAGAGGASMLVTSGTSGALVLLAQTLLGPGDEMIVGDPYFSLYPGLAALCGARMVACDTYPDFRLTAARVEPLITERTKFVLLTSPGNPSGVVCAKKDVADLLDLCRRRGVLLVSDEIYDDFTFRAHRGDACVGDARRARCPSPARLAGAEEDVLVIRGFGKTYGVTGWRLGYAVGPRALIEQMTKINMYTYVCAPTPLQFAAAAAYGVDMDPIVDGYERRRDMVLERLRSVTEVTEPGGAFYVFPKVPERLGISSTQFVERCVEKKLLVVPGKAFSTRDTHFRVSLAATDEVLGRGCEVLCGLMAG